MIYSPRIIYHFMKSEDFRSILNIAFYKRHMEDADKKSPFDTAEEIFLFEYLIASGYVIASYRNDANNDSEIYLLSTMGHAFLENYSKSFLFRLRLHMHYYRIVYGVFFASMLGSLIASVIYEKFLSLFF